MDATLTPDEALRHLTAASQIAGIEAGDVSLPESRQIVAGGMRLHCLDWGPGPDPALVFLHGGWLNAHSWDLVCLALRDRHRAIAMDQRGHGDSEWSPALDYGAPAHAADIAGAIDAFGLDRPIVVGQSMGGINALTYAARDHASPTALVVIDTGPTITWDEGVTRVSEFVMATDTFDSVDEIVNRALAFNPRRDAELLRVSVRHNLRKLPDGRWSWKYDRRSIPERMEATRTGMTAVRDLLGRVACPVLVVRGADSDVFSDHDAEVLVDELPDARAITIADAGHTVQGDNPRELAAVIGKFAASLSRP